MHDWPFATAITGARTIASAGAWSGVAGNADRTNGDEAVVVFGYCPPVEDPAIPVLTGVDRQPRHEMGLPDALAVLDALAGAGCRTWVHGGWGVDALLQEQTRPHDDLDLVVDVTQWPAVREALSHLGYTVVVDGMPGNTVLLDPAGRQVDLHPARIDRAGNARYSGDDGSAWDIPADALHSRGAIAGREVACLGPEIEVASHAGYALDDDDRADVAALVARFGVRPPTGF